MLIVGNAEQGVVVRQGFLSVVEGLTTNGIKHLPFVLIVSLSNDRSLS
jgi:hypothetical protein